MYSNKLKLHILFSLPNIEQILILYVNDIQAQPVFQICAISKVRVYILETVVCQGDWSFNVIHEVMFPMSVLIYFSFHDLETAPHSLPVFLW